MSISSPMIFVVDDDESVRRAMKRLMRSVGFRAETFPCAEDFLEYAHRDEGDCLILDIRMPGLSGLALQRELAASGCTLPIVFITAHEDQEARPQAMNAGAVAVLRKPFDDQVLLDAIREARRQRKTGGGKDVNSTSGGFVL